MKQCDGCAYATNEGCTKYSYPAAQWGRIGGCAMRPKEVKSDGEKKINPIKASKRGIKQ